MGGCAGPKQNQSSALGALSSYETLESRDATLLGSGNLVTFLPNPDSIPVGLRGDHVGDHDSWADAICWH